MRALIRSLARRRRSSPRWRSAVSTIAGSARAAVPDRARAVGVHGAVRAAPAVGPGLHAGRRDAVHREGRAPSGSASPRRASVRTLADPSRRRSRMGEGGMMGVAVDPGFRTNRRVYTCFLSNRSGALDVRVVRWRMNDAVTALTDRADIVTGHAGEHRAALGVPAAVRARRSALDRHRRRRHADGARRARRRSAARCCASTPTGRACRGTRRRRSTRGSTPTGTATCRASPSARAARRTRSSTARAATTRSTGSSPAPTTAGTRGRCPARSFYDESRPMTDTTRHPGARPAVWSSGDPTIAPSGGDVHLGVRAGRAGTGSLAMAVLKDQHLRVLQLRRQRHRGRHPVGAHHRPGPAAGRRDAPDQRHRSTSPPTPTPAASSACVPS